MKSPRQCAFDILLKIHRDNAYSNIAVDAALESGNDSQLDRAFVSALVYSVLERLITIDYQLTLYLSKPLKKLRPEVLTALRMGVCQLLFMDKIPVSACVNESVKLVKANSAAFASGLVNAVLRKVAAAGLQLPDKSNLLRYYSVKYSCPEWMLSLWSKAYGQDNAVGIAKASLGAADTVMRVNTLKTDSSQLIISLESKGIDCRNTQFAKDSVEATKTGSLKELDEYKDGLFHVQDYASGLCCEALAPISGETVIDVCSAPGGKAFTAAQYMKNSGRIIACDIYQSRLDMIKSGAARLGINIIETKINDASVFNPAFPQADRVLCDVPCAGLGVIRKKPEIRCKKKEEVDKLPEIQYSIMTESSKYLKSGGLMVYSTCSLNPDENENVLRRFLTENPDFESVRVLPHIKRYGEDTDYLTLMPHIHGCDGFFISAVRRRNGI